MKDTTATLDQYPDKQHRSRSTRKIWQIDSRYHCSIIGSCLSNRELRLFGRKKSFEIDRGSSNYEIHNILVHAVSLRSQQSRVLQKYLNVKYRLILKKYLQAQSKQELQKYWEEDLTSPNISGAYWALQCHPLADRKFITRIYGECHMAGFEGFHIRQKHTSIYVSQQKKADQFKEHNRLQAARIQNLEEKNRKLQGDLIHYQNQCQQLSKEKEFLQTELEKAIDNLENTRSLLENQPISPPGNKGNPSGKKHLMHDTEKDLKKQLKQQWELLFEYEEQNEHLKSDLHDLRNQFDSQARELRALEQQAMTELRRQLLCPDCEDHPTDRCSGQDLCGKTVLYVGGLHKMIPRYRQVVEQCGGNFIHHDGGRESSKHMLPKLLTGADAVLCPVDCISHDACKRVKKVCKQYSKPFVMMRSSGLSSLARGLQTITQ